MLCVDVAGEDIGDQDITGDIIVEH
jgi:hypothetical protein